jgi:hypothetical protein
MKYLIYEWLLIDATVYLSFEPLLDPGCPVTWGNLECIAESRVNPEGDINSRHSSQSNSNNYWQWWRPMCHKATKDRE